MSSYSYALMKILARKPKLVKEYYGNRCVVKLYSSWTKQSHTPHINYTHWNYLTICPPQQMASHKHTNLLWHMFFPPVFLAFSQSHMIIKENHTDQAISIVDKWQPIRMKNQAVIILSIYTKEDSQLKRLYSFNVHTLESLRSTQPFTWFEATLNIPKLNLNFNGSKNIEWLANH
jgi:hypothetical protein